MRNDIFQQALLATARVACAAALMGCGDKDDTSSEDTQVAEQSDDTNVSADDSASTDDSSSTDSLAECNAHVTEAAANSAPTAQTEECCQLIAEDWDTRELDGMENWMERDFCCELLEWQGSLACTPWGPPTPPAFGGALV